MFQETGVSLSALTQLQRKYAPKMGVCQWGGHRPFINGLPGGKSTSHFSTADASGSTSQASAIVEALEVGATHYDRRGHSSTNFMIRDARMERLVKSDQSHLHPPCALASLQRGVVGLGCRRMWRLL